MQLNQLVERLSKRNFPIPFPGHWVANKWQQYANAKGTPPSLNPGTGELLISCSSEKQILLDALAQADVAQPKILEMSYAERIEIIRRMRQALTDYRDTFILAMRIQCGKPLWEAETDFDGTINFIDNLLKTSGNLPDAILGPAKLDLAKGEFTNTPIGTVFAYLPFSTPMLSFARYFSAAMITGCPLIICPSMHANLCGLLYAYLCETLDLIPGSVSIIFGTFENFQSVIGDKRMQAIIYTGSREHCDLIRRESRGVSGRQLILQSGGKNSVLVHSSADIDVAVRCVMQGAFKSAGQLCTSTSRVFVHKTLIENFCGKLFEKTQAMGVGRTDTGDAESGQLYMGPLYSMKAVEKFLRYQTMAHREAQKDLLWGKAQEANDEGCLVMPGIHLMKSFDKTSAYQSNVLFCPDIAIYEYDVLDHAIDMLNTTDAPYCTSFIGEAEILNERRHRFIAPNLLINLPTVAAEVHPCLTGKYFSGHHRFNGLGLCSLLSYPQLIQSPKNHSELLKTWPS